MNFNGRLKRTRNVCSFSGRQVKGQGHFVNKNFNQNSVPTKQQSLRTKLLFGSTLGFLPKIMEILTIFLKNKLRQMWKICTSGAIICLNEKTEPKSLILHKTFCSLHGFGGKTLAKTSVFYRTSYSLHGFQWNITQWFPEGSQLNWAVLLFKFRYIGSMKFIPLLPILVVASQGN